MQRGIWNNEGITCKVKITSKTKRNNKIKTKFRGLTIYSQLEFDYKLPNSKTQKQLLI